MENLLKAELLRRGVPALRTKEEMIDIMQREVYGYLPTPEYKISVSEPQLIEKRYVAGTVQQTRVELTIEVGGGSHSFSVDRMLHIDGKKRPLIIHNNFHRMAESVYFPREEMSEYDVDFLVFCYTDVASDDGDFSNGLAPLLLPNGQDRGDTCGKIGIWAWAAMRVLDYGLTLEGTDPDNVAIVGHSRLGKTAGYTAMLDERFKFVYSNAAGCGGDALAHGSSGQGREFRDTSKAELICDLIDRFPYWFCKNYRKYAEKNISDDFDQHFVFASIAPRYAFIASCDLDGWADPASQQLCALAASEAWEREGLEGIMGCDRYIDNGEALLDGHMAYAKVHSLHFLSRHLWRFFMEFVEKHR